jgi:hypothetical protein
LLLAIIPLVHLILLLDCSNLSPQIDIHASYCFIVSSSSVSKEVGIPKRILYNILLYCGCELLWEKIICAWPTQLYGCGSFNL